MLRHSLEITPYVARLLSHDIRWQIMILLSNDETNYAKRISEELGISESNVHYHMAKLREAGLIVPIGIKTGKRRGRAKLFKPVAAEYYLSLDPRLRREQTDIVFDRIFARHFVKNGEFDGKIIVGSADPHGAYNAVSRDAFLAGELAWYIGSHLAYYDKESGSFPYYVMTDLDYENQPEVINCVLIGGHITNTLTAHYNEILEGKFGVRFVENRIMAGSEIFAQAEHGLVALFEQPANPGYWTFILAGVGSMGTKSAIRAITSDCCDTFGDGPEFVTIIHGESEDGRTVTGVKKLLGRTTSS